MFVGLSGVAGGSQGDVGAGTDGVGTHVVGIARCSIAAYGAAVVVVVGVGAVNISCNGTVNIDSRYGGAKGETVGHVAVETAHDTAVSTDASEAVGHGEGGGADAAEDGAAIALAHHAAVTIGRVGYSMDGNIAAYTAVLYDALTFVVRNISRNAADIMLTGDAGVGQSDVLDSSTRSPTEEALVVVSIVVAALIDADTPDGFALTVEGAAEVFIATIIIAADGGEVVLFAGGIVPSSGMVVGDGVTQFEELTIELVATVHQRSQQVEALGVADGVGLLGAGAVNVCAHAPDVGGGGGDGDGGSRHRRYCIGVVTIVGDGYIIAASGLNCGDGHGIACQCSDIVGKGELRRSAGIGHAVDIRSVVVGPVVSAGEVRAATHH